MEKISMCTQERNSLLQDKSNEELMLMYKRSKDLRIKQEIVMRYIYIVRGISIQMRDVYRGFAQLDDIVNEGVIALMGAVDKFDPDKNIKFETYISKRLRGMIIDMARKQDWIPRSVRKSAKEIDNATMELYHKYGRYPTEEETAEYLHMDLKKFQNIVGNTTLFNILSIDMISDDTNDNRQNFHYQMQNQGEQPEQQFLDNEMKKVLAKGIESLRDNEQKVIALYYVEELNMKEIAEIMQVSEPRISQIHSNAIRKLKIYMDNFINDR